MSTLMCTDRQEMEPVCVCMCLFIICVSVYVLTSTQRHSCREMTSAICTRPSLSLPLWSPSLSSSIICARAVASSAHLFFLFFIGFFLITSAGKETGECRLVRLGSSCCAGILKWTRLNMYIVHSKSERRLPFMPRNYCSRSRCVTDMENQIVSRSSYFLVNMFLLLQHQSFSMTLFPSHDMIDGWPRWSVKVSS